MNFKEMYEAKRISAADLAASVESGWVFGMDAGPTRL